jgi:hypothetical protein
MVWNYGAVPVNPSIIQRSQSKILRMIVDAPWYVPNATLHADLGVSYVQDAIHQKCNKHHTTLETDGGVTTINVRLQMVCSFIGTLCKYTTRIMRSLRCSSLMLLVGGWLRWPGDCSWSRLTALLLGRLLGVFAFHWGSLDGACCSVKPDEAREGVDPAGSHLSLRRPAPVPGYIAAYRTCRANTRTALLELYVLTGPCYLVDWLTELNCVVSLTALRRTQVKTLLATIYVAIRWEAPTTCFSKHYW